jgi:hypothetical protein
MTTQAEWFNTPADDDHDGPSYRMPPLLTRKEFLSRFKKDYKPGQHVTGIGPTQRGKSRLCQEMLKQVLSEFLKAGVLVGKPPGRERTWSDDAAKQLQLVVVSEWPPTIAQQYQIKRRHGFLLRPKHTLKDPAADDANIARQFKSGILRNYSQTKKVKWITVVDETHQAQVDLGLKKECEAPLMRGAPDNAMWSLVQRARNISYLCYDSPEHILIFRDDDRSNQQRYSEIGGVDAGYLSYVVRNLKTERVKSGGTISQCVYFRRSGSEIYLVDT